MAIYLGTATPSAYKLGANNVSAIYRGTTAVWPVVTSNQLTLTATGGAAWDSGGDGLSSATAYTKASWSGGSNSEETLKATAVSAGVINVTWTANNASDSESSYGEISIWRNVPLFTGSPAVDLQGAASAPGSYSTSVSAGQYVILYRYGLATWGGIKVWWTA